MEEQQETASHVAENSRLPKHLHGKSFKKGQSGNPGGRPKQEHEVVQLARKHGPEAIKRLAYWLKSDELFKTLSQGLLNIIIAVAAYYFGSRRSTKQQPQLLAGSQQ